MAKGQAKQETTTTDDAEIWASEDAVEFEDAANDAQITPAKNKLVMRHKIEDLIESRRLKKQLGDYEVLDLDEEKPHRVH